MSAGLSAGALEALCSLPSYIRPNGMAHIGNDTFLVAFSGQNVSSVCLCTSSFPPDSRVTEVPLNRSVSFNFGPLLPSTSSQKTSSAVDAAVSCMRNANEPHDEGFYHRLYPSPDGRVVAVIAQEHPTAHGITHRNPHKDFMRKPSSHYFLVVTEIPFKVYEWRTPVEHLVQSVCWFMKKSAHQEAQEMTEMEGEKEEGTLSSKKNAQTSKSASPLLSDSVVVSQNDATSCRRLLVLLHTGELLSYDVSFARLDVSFPQPDGVDTLNVLFGNTSLSRTINSLPCKEEASSALDASQHTPQNRQNAELRSHPVFPFSLHDSDEAGHHKEEMQALPFFSSGRPTAAQATSSRAAGKMAPNRTSLSHLAEAGAMESKKIKRRGAEAQRISGEINQFGVGQVRTAFMGGGSASSLSHVDSRGTETGERRPAEVFQVFSSGNRTSNQQQGSGGCCHQQGDEARGSSPAAPSACSSAKGPRRSPTSSARGMVDSAVPQSADSCKKKETKPATAVSWGDDVVPEKGNRAVAAGSGIPVHPRTRSTVANIQNSMINNTGQDQFSEGKDSHFVKGDAKAKHTITTDYATYMFFKKMTKKDKSSRLDAHRHETEKDFLRHWFGDLFHLVVDIYMVPSTRSLPPVLLLLTRHGDVYAAKVSGEKGLPLAPASCTPRPTSPGSGLPTASGENAMAGEAPLSCSDKVVHHLIKGTAEESYKRNNHSEDSSGLGLALAVRSVLLDEDTGLHAVLIAYEHGRVTVTLVEEPQLLARDRAVIPAAETWEDCSVENNTPGKNEKKRRAEERINGIKKDDNNGDGHHAMLTGNNETSFPSPPLHRSTLAYLPLAPQWHLHLGRCPPDSSFATPECGGEVGLGTSVQMEVVRQVCLVRYEESPAYLVVLPRWSIARGGWTYWNPFVGGKQKTAIFGSGGEPSKQEKENRSSFPGERTETALIFCHGDDTSRNIAKNEQAGVSENSSPSLSSSPRTPLEEEEWRWSLVQTDSSTIPDPISLRIPFDLRGLSVGVGIREVLLAPCHTGSVLHGASQDVLHATTMFSLQIPKLLRGAICATSNGWEWTWLRSSLRESIDDQSRAAEVAPTSNNMQVVRVGKGLKEKAKRKTNEVDRIDYFLREALRNLSLAYRNIFSEEEEETVEAASAALMKCLETCVNLQEEEEKVLKEREEHLQQRVQLLQYDTSYASRTIDTWESTVLEAIVHQRGEASFFTANNRLGAVHDILTRMEYQLGNISIE